jgi:hypothetical protein
MNYRNLIVFLFFTASLAGCISAPKSPEAIIASAKGGEVFTEKDVFEVNQPIEHVSEVLKKKSHECFEQEISFTARGDTAGGVRMDRREVRELTPKIHVGKERTRLTLQVKSTGGSTDLGAIPPGGWYMLVVDAYPEGKNKTRVESYYKQTSYHGAFTAIKPWVTGTNVACPDLTK